MSNNLLWGRSLYQEFSNSTEVLEHKRAGDILYEKGEIKEALKEYLKAITKPEQFNNEELLNMAKRISWGGDFTNAEKILKLILERDPENKEATLHLARVISWQGRQFESLRIIQKFLIKTPNDREALFIKANTLRYLGRPDLSEKIYTKLLLESEDFDIRIAQTYGYLQLGLSKKVQENLSFLKPNFSYQERELKELKQIVREFLSPSTRINYLFFQDNDKNEVQSVSLGLEGYINNTKIGLILGYKDASDSLTKTESEDIRLYMNKRILPKCALTIDFGLTKGGRDDTFVTGKIGLDVFILYGLLTLEYKRNLLTNTRELIDNQITTDNFIITLSQTLTDRWSIFSNIGYILFSDSNNAKQINAHLKYKINFKYPNFYIGYKFIYLNFDEHKYNGYFDPKDYYSPQLTFTLLHEKEGFSLFIEPFTGYQVYKRYGRKRSEWIYGGVAHLKTRLTSGSNLVVNLEGGNYAAGTATGWKYYQVGASLKYSF